MIVLLLLAVLVVQGYTAFLLRQLVANTAKVQVIGLKSHSGRVPAPRPPIPA